MDSEYSNTSFAKFSETANDPDFLNAMRKYLKKTFKYAIISIPVIFVVIIAIVALLERKNSGGAGTVALTAVVLAVIFACIAVGMLISLLKNLKKLGKGSVDGTVLKTSKWRSVGNEKKSGKYKCTINISADNGKKYKLKDRYALAYYNHLAVGDKVRYHFGYPFPLEIYDKANKNINICVFCGKGNAPTDKECSVCKNPMLI